MHVTTGGITIAVGTVIVLALGGAAVKVVRDEANDTTAAFEDCEPQARATAREAQRHLVAQYVRSEPESATGWFTGAYTTRTEGLRQQVASIREDGIPVSDLIPEDFGEGYILVVNHEPDTDLPSLPTCVEGTPVLYVGGGPTLAG
jgi:hypothetical protein